MLWFRQGKGLLKNLPNLADCVAVGVSLINQGTLNLHYYPIYQTSALGRTQV